MTQKSQFNVGIARMPAEGLVTATDQLNLIIVKKVAVRMQGRQTRTKHQPSGYITKLLDQLN